VLRGGSWNNNDPRNLLSSYRNNNTPRIVTTTTGFVVCWWWAARLQGATPRKMGAVPGGYACPARAKRSPNRPAHPPRKCREKTRCRPWPVVLTDESHGLLFCVAAFGRRPPFSFSNRPVLCRRTSSPLAIRPYPESGARLCAEHQSQNGGQDGCSRFPPVSGRPGTKGTTRRAVEL